MLLLVFIASSFIGRCIAKKYSYRLEELEEILPRNVAEELKKYLESKYEKE